MIRFFHKIVSMEDLPLNAFSRYKSRPCFFFMKPGMIRIFCESAVCRMFILLPNGRFGHDTTGEWESIRILERFGLCGFVGASFGRRLAGEAVRKNAISDFLLEIRYSGSKRFPIRAETPAANKGVPRGVPLICFFPYDAFGISSGFAVRQIHAPPGRRGPVRFL